MKLPERPHPTLTVASVAVAYGAFAAVFRGPRSRFWQRMTRTGLGLGALALATEGELRRARPRPKDVATGVAIAAALYGVFQVGDRAARRVMPSGAEDIGDVYELRRLRPKGEIAARLTAVIGPAEELYWRGMLQTELTRRLGPVRGAAAAAAIYGGAHVVTGNPTLVGAATVAGTGWSALAALGVPMPALVVSHLVWDVWIFLVRPTQPLSG
ncbi:MAG: type II CAAX prenyl endopeptidase Rce1 family protein [Mycobacteriales bacterium]